MTESSEKILITGLQKLGVPFSHKRIVKIKNFIKELYLFNSRFDLVKAETYEEIVVRHVLDSLAGFEFLVRNEVLQIADIGSGAGFPGIPLSIFLPDSKFTLVERSERRTSFLQNMKGILRLNNIEIHCKNYENLNCTFDVVTTRALAPLDKKVFNELFALLNNCGFLFLYKGNLKKTQNEIKDLKLEIQAKNAKVNIFPVKVPFLESQRCFVKISKI